MPRARLACVCVRVCVRVGVQFGGMLSVKPLMYEILPYAREILASCGGEVVNVVDLLEDSDESAPVQGIGHGLFLDAILATFDEGAESRARHRPTIATDGVHHPQGGRGGVNAHTFGDPIDGSRVEEVDLFLTHAMKGRMR